MDVVHGDSTEAKKEEADVENVADTSTVQSTGNGDVVEPSGTKREIKSRHAQMIAIGGTIGTSLFITSGQALAIGGPGFLLPAYCLMSLMVYGVTTAVVEVGTYLPLPGASMALFCSRYVSRSLGLALGYLYFYSFGVAAAYEVTAATILIDWWPHGVHVAVWITVLLVVIVAINICPVGIYAEGEFWFAGIKVVLITGLLVLSVVLMLGGGPSGQRLGFYYWYDPGAVKSYIVGGAGGRLTAFIYVWNLSGFSFLFSPELVIFTSGEMRNPRKNLPVASRRFFYRLAFFYVLGSAAIGAICSSNAPGLTSGAGNADASPWVIAIQNAGISTLPSIVNAGILTSAWSAGISYVYMSSRSLYSLAVAGNAPRLFKRCNRWGVPYYTIMASCCFLPLSYMTVSSEAGVVFNWLVNLTNTGGFTSWFVCCITCIRFRKACDSQGVAVPYRSLLQPWAAWTCMLLFGSLLLLNGFTNFFPGRFTAAGFLSAYIGIPIFLAIWLGHKLTLGRHDPWMYNPVAVDLVSGRAEVEADEEMWKQEEEADHQARKYNANKVWQFVSRIWE